MKKLISLILFSLIFIFSTRSQDNYNESWESSLDKWESGNYISAIEDFKKILNSQNANKYFEEIALLTGELFKVHEITSDGSSMQFSAGGNYIT